MPAGSLLLVTRNLPPLRGGMERLNARMAIELAADYLVTVLAPKGSVLPLTPGLTLRTSPFRGTAGFLVWAFVATAAEALHQRPAWVLGGSGLVAPAVWLAARLSGARSALYLHGLDIVVNHPVYRMLWLPLIRRVHLAFANSRNTAALAMDAGIPPDRIAVVPPGTDRPVNDPDTGTALQFRQAHGLGDGPVLLSVGRLTARKGMVEFVDAVLPRVVRERPSTTLVVIGDNAPDALATHGGDQMARLRIAATRQGLGERVKLLGPVSEEQLAAAYDASDVHVFPVRDVPGDVEGFGMVAIEAAGHGLPTVAFAVGGVPDAVAHGVSGLLVNGGDSDGMAHAISQVLTKGRASFDGGCRGFAEGFLWPHFGARVRGELAARRRPS